MTVYCQMDERGSTRLCAATSRRIRRECYWGCRRTSRVVSALPGRVIVDPTVLPQRLGFAIEQPQRAFDTMPVAIDLVGGDRSFPIDPDLHSMPQVYARWFTIAVVEFEARKTSTFFSNEIPSW